MWREKQKYVRLLLLSCILCAAVSADEMPRSVMSKEERMELKEEARDMFYHAYRAYMENAYPADELMPLTCQGRYRGVTPSRGDMDDVLGNFSLTLVDSLDTLVILGDFEEFENAVKLVITDVSFDKNIIVSVFETNIRMLGGLLSAHILATELRKGGEYFMWYKNELLDLAHDLGLRLLPAFNSSTGIPYARINLKYGMRGIKNSKETCTACAGTMILEMAALSRLVDDPIFEEKAHEAMDQLWNIRHRTSDLMGSVVNVDSGDWIRKNSGVGAGIDSYYEYCFKAYILLGDENYLARFQKHYSAVMKYISKGPMMLDVNMHRPHTQSRHFMDALLAFWPGLQVMLGDVRSAIETHEMLYQVMQKHTFIPEAFTADFQVHWGQHPLRPEFLESTYFLHRATGDDHYLEVGKNALKSLQKHARVPCGYAAINDVRTRNHEDRMDSFVLAETFKYLYMLFAEDSDIPINLDEYIMTTEAHLLPLTLSTKKAKNITLKDSDGDLRLYQYSRSCPNTHKFVPESVRNSLKNIIGECSTQQPQTFRRLYASQFRPSDPQHVALLAEMGISVLAMNDGRVQLLQTFSMARTPKDAEEGILFMREMAELSDKPTKTVDSNVKTQGIALLSANPLTVMTGGPAHFGLDLKNDIRVIGTVTISNPLNACEPLTDITSYVGKIVIAERGDCTFAEKVRRLQKEGAIGVIIADNVPNSSHETAPLFAMSGDGETDITIPAIFLYSENANILTYHIFKNPDAEIMLGEYNSLKKYLKATMMGENESFVDLQDIHPDVDINHYMQSIKPQPAIVEEPKIFDTFEDDMPLQYKWLQTFILDHESVLAEKNRQKQKPNYEQNLSNNIDSNDNIRKPAVQSDSVDEHPVDINQKLRKHLEIITKRMGSIELINKLLKESYDALVKHSLDAKIGSMSQIKKQDDTIKKLDEIQEDNLNTKDKHSIDSKVEDRKKTNSDVTSIGNMPKESLLDTPKIQSEIINPELTFQSLLPFHKDDTNNEQGCEDPTSQACDLLISRKIYESINPTNIMSKVKENDAMSTKCYKKTIVDLVNEYLTKRPIR